MALLETLQQVPGPRHKSTRLKQPMERRVFPAGKDPKKRSYEDVRWSRFKNFSQADMFTVVNEHAVLFLRTHDGNGSTYAHHMKDARFTIQSAALLAEVVDLLAQVPMEDRDTKGELCESMLGKIATAGQNGQFRIPRHIIRLMIGKSVGVVAWRDTLLPKPIFGKLRVKVAERHVAEAIA